MRARRGLKPQKRAPGDNKPGVLIHATGPPQIRPQITHAARLRFTSNAAGTQSVTYAMLMDLILVATTATQLYDLFDSVKVSLVEMWCQGVTNSPTTVTCDWNGGVNGLADDSKQDADTSLGIEPAHIVSRPSRNSMARFWAGSSNVVCFSITCPAETVIDVQLTFKNSSVAPVAALNLGVGATAGQFYFRGLDGQATAGTKYNPIALLVI